MLRQAIIIGAGFSHYAGLPLQSRFTAELLSAAGFTKGPSKRLVDFLCEFVRDTYHPRYKLDPDGWPELEDLFTCIDLSANSGHHLGAEHAPGRLRTVRRALIARTIRMLRQAYEHAKGDADEPWQQLEAFLQRVQPATDAFISLSWDTVAEERMLELHPDLTVNYGASFVPAEFPTKGTSIVRLPKQKKRPKVPFAKIHGSINWLYCDNCRNVYWFPPHDAVRIADQLLSAEEWKSIAPRAPANARQQWECDRCTTVKLSTRIATFSYRKALDFPMFHQSWQAAESILTNAARWVFIGYSLPAADYEFKYLLKRVELTRADNPPDIILVTGGDGADTTRNNYRRFFGTRVNRRVFDDGLDDDAVEYITTGVVP